MLTLKVHEKKLGSILCMYLIICNNNKKNNELQIKFHEKFFHVCVLFQSPASVFVQKLLYSITRKSRNISLQL